MSESNRNRDASERAEWPYAAQVKRVAWAGLLANVVLSGLKFAAGILGRSQVVVADAVHSLSDCVTDAALLVGVRYWSKPADEDHPHGHQRIETVITVVIALVLAGVAAALAYRALATLRAQDAAPPGWIAFAAAAISIVTKEGLYRWTAAVGKRIRSSAVMANAWHHRSDALSSVPAALAVAGAAVDPSWSFLDHVGAVLVSGFILHAAWKIGWPALGQLVDRGASERVRRDLQAVALDTEGVQTVHAIRTRYIGSGIEVDLHIQVDPDLTVRRGHEISGAVERRLLASGQHVLDVVVHLEPYEGT